MSGPCDQVPTAIDKETLSAYAEKCGKDVALKWASKELGVEVGSCAKEAAKDVPECVANNYGITFDVINKDGSINWDNVVRDAGAVGGIIVCAATGVGAAGLPLCGKLGAELAKAFVDMGKAIAKVGEAIISLLWSGDDGGGHACGKTTGYVLPQYAARDIVVYLKQVKSFSASTSGSLKLGPVVSGTQFLAQDKGTFAPDWQRYWSRVFKLRGLAQVTASLIVEISKKAGVSPEVAALALAPSAPPGWSDLMRPLLNVPPGSPNKGDVMGNLGGLLDAMMYKPVVVKGTSGDCYGQPCPDPIRPSWQKPEFWSSIDRAASDDKVWRYFSLTVGCPNNIVAWGEIKDLTLAKSLLSAARDQGTVTISNKSDSKRWNWWAYSTPRALDELLIAMDPIKFSLACAAWRASLEKDLDKKIAAARAMGSGSGAGLGSSIVKVAAGLGAAALLAKWLLPKLNGSKSGTIEKLRRLKFS